MAKKELISKRGSFKVYEDGSATFNPTQEGTKEGNMKLVHQGEDWSLYESKNCYKVALTFSKDLTFNELGSLWRKAMKDATDIIMTRTL